MNRDMRVTKSNYFTTDTSDGIVRRNPLLGWVSIIGLDATE
jgi:hypothetical protein